MLKQVIRKVVAKATVIFQWGPNWCINFYHPQSKPLQWLKMTVQWINATDMVSTKPLYASQTYYLLQGLCGCSRKIATQWAALQGKKKQQKTNKKNMNINLWLKYGGRSYHTVCKNHISGNAKLFITIIPVFNNEHRCVISSEVEHHKEPFHYFFATCALCIILD